MGNWHLVDTQQSIVFNIHRGLDSRIYNRSRPDGILMWFRTLENHFGCQLLCDERLFFFSFSPSSRKQSYFLELSVKNLSLIMTNLIPKKLEIYLHSPKSIWPLSQNPLDNNSIIMDGGGNSIREEC